MVESIIKTSNAQNALENSLEKTESSVAHISQNIAMGTAYDYDDGYGRFYDFNSIPVHTNANNNIMAGNNIDMATDEDMNLTTNMLKLVTSSTAYKATATALKSVNKTEDDVIRQLIGTNEG